MAGWQAPSKGLRTPSYDRSSLTEGIVHIGVGGFHRAHEAVYTDDVFSTTDEKNWAICGVGLLPHDQRMKEALESQDYLYTLVEKSAGKNEARVVGSITSFLLALENPEKVLAKLSSSEIRIVSLTITEGGYCLNQSTGEFDGANADVQVDLANPHTPRTVFGYVTEALRRRRDAGTPAFTLLSCDNIQHNGDVARKMFLSFAELCNPGLAEWISQNVAFPNCMVDRITPATTDADREMVRTEFGIDDAWPVVCEPFRQWVVEDNFCNGRPSWERVGAQMTHNVHPYEAMKIRLLNGSHSAMAYLGYLAGFTYIHEVMADMEFQTYIQRLMDEEVTPILMPVPGVDLEQYKATLIERFANPNIGDQVARICMDGSNKLPKFIFPTAEEQLARAGQTHFLALAVASWCRFLNGTDEKGYEISLDDPRAETLRGAAIAGGHKADKLFAMEEVFGSLGTSKEFINQVNKALQSLYDMGARKTLRRYLASVS
ncbi:MAG: mannitol dehydrogenase family protein [Fimbriimonas sp.]|nr:mannitol dehydrogenase family protein [Fimbriimonas sp.]